MPWQEVSALDQRREFARLAVQKGVNRRELFRRFGISPDVGYKWLARYMAGDAELEDRSRRARQSPARSDAAIEALALALRDEIRVVAAPTRSPTRATKHLLENRNNR
jgi:transposase